MTAENNEKRTEINVATRSRAGVSRRSFGGAIAALAAPSILRAQQPNEIVIGAILPLTGPGSGYGQDNWTGVQAGCDFVNSQGGIKSLGGAKLKAIIGDSETKPEVAAAQVENLARRGASVLIGCAQSSATLVASQQAERLRIPILCANDLDPLITARGFKHVFRNNPQQTRLAADLFAYIKALTDKNRPATKRVVILVENSTLGLTSQKSALENAAKYGMEVVDNSTYESGKSQNFASYVSKYKALNAEIFVGYNQVADGLSIVRAMKEQHFNPLVFGGISGAPVAQSFLDNAGPDANGILTNLTWIDSMDIPELKQIRNSYGEGAGKKAIDLSFMTSFTNVMVIRDALERGKSADRAALRDAIASTNLKWGERGYLLLSGVKYTATGDNERAESVVVTIRDKKWVPVAPGHLARGEAIFPKPQWT